MKHLSLLSIIFCSLSLFSCGNDAEDLPLDSITDYGQTLSRQQLCDAFGLNPSDMDWDTYGVCQEEHFLLFSALRKTDNKLVVAAFDSLWNRQVIYDCSISIPKTTTQPHYDQQMEYNLHSVRPYIIRINDGFACAIGTTYKSEYDNGNSFGNTYTYFFNGLDLTCLMIEDGFVVLNAWYANSCLLTSRDQTLCITTDGEIKAKSEKHVYPISSTYEQFYYPIYYDKFIDLGIEYKHGSGRYYFNAYCKRIAEKEIATEWSTYSTLPEEISPSARISFAVEDRHTDVWQVRVDAIEKDGTQFHYQLYIDINSGECTLKATPNILSR